MVGWRQFDPCWWLGFCLGVIFAFLLGRVEYRNLLIWPADIKVYVVRLGFNVLSVLLGYAYSSRWVVMGKRRIWWDWYSGSAWFFNWCNIMLLCNIIFWIVFYQFRRCFKRIDYELICSFERWRLLRRCNCRYRPWFRCFKVVWYQWGLRLVQI